MKIVKSEQKLVSKKYKLKFVIKEHIEAECIWFYENVKI